MNFNNVQSFPSEQDLTAFRLVKLTSGGNVDYVAATTDIALGTVLQDTESTHPDKGMADVHLINSGGVDYATADTSGANIAVGDPIIGSTIGRIAKQANAELAIGVALEATTVDNTVIRVTYFGSLPKS